MASTKYIGYVGGVAVAVGVGAAVAAAGQGVAHADDADTGSKATTNAGPVKKAIQKAVQKTSADIHDTVSKIADNKTAGTSKVADTKPSAKVTAQATKPKTKFSEAEQVKNLQGLFQPKKSATVTAKAEEEAADDPNPFRADDPDPTDMPDTVLEAEKALLAGIPDTLAPVKPFVREGYEAAYRYSQVVPFVNVPIPLTRILPVLAGAAAGDKAGAQTVINQLLLTTPAVSLVYYGYDEAADLLNMEPEADVLKQEFYATAWDTLDPLGVLHPIEQAEAVNTLEKQFAVNAVTLGP